MIDLSRLPSDAPLLLAKTAGLYGLCLLGGALLAYSRYLFSFTWHIYLILIPAFIVLSWVLKDFKNSFFGVIGIVAQIGIAGFVAVPVLHGIQLIGFEGIALFHTGKLIVSILSIVGAMFLFMSLYLFIAGERFNPWIGYGIAGIPALVAAIGVAFYHFSFSLLIGITLGLCLSLFAFDRLEASVAEKDTPFRALWHLVATTLGLTGTLAGAYWSAVREAKTSDWSEDYEEDEDDELDLFASPEQLRAHNRRNLEQLFKGSPLSDLGTPLTHDQILDQLAVRNFDGTPEKTNSWQSWDTRGWKPPDRPEDPTE